MEVSTQSFKEKPVTWRTNGRMVKCEYIYPTFLRSHLVLPQFSIVFTLKDPLRSKLINVKKLFCVYWRIFRRPIQLRLLLNVFAYVFATLSWSFLSKTNLPSCHHIDRVRQHQKPTENKIFEAWQHLCWNLQGEW